jgi:hypothetical protein
LPSVRLVKIFYPGTIPFDPLPGVVGGAVVDDKNFDLLERVILRENAIDGLLDELAVVMRRDEDCDQGRASLLKIA